MMAVDTNLLFAWLNRSHGDHAASARWFHAQAENSELALCELNLVELYGLLRNAVILERPLEAPAATDLIQRLRRHPHWELLDYPGGLMEGVWDLAGHSNFPRRRIYDVRLALTLRHHGVTEFATANIKDFEDFGFKRVWNPLKSRSA